MPWCGKCNKRHEALSSMGVWYAEGNKVAGQSLPTPRRALNTPRSARTPRAGSKRDRKVTSSKKKKKSSLSPEQQPVSVQD